jgi:hypothetical protein
MGLHDQHYMAAIDPQVRVTADAAKRSSQHANCLNFEQMSLLLTWQYGESRFHALATACARQFCSSCVRRDFGVRNLQTPRQM